MSFRHGGVKLVRRVARHVDLPVAILPAFLCPGILNNGPTLRISRCFQSQRSYYTTEISPREQELPTSRPLASTLEPALSSKLPIQCPGCGALSQIVEKEEPGFYSLTRGSVKKYFQATTTTKNSRQREIFENSMEVWKTSEKVPEDTKIVVAELNSAFIQSSVPPASSEPPVCDRCHNLKHHETGVSIHHPSVQSLQDTIFESPHKYNHIYHIVDAADFPMSLVQGLHKLLHLTPQRSLNRRSQAEKFYHGRKTEVSFIISRSDLLGPTKDHVDKLMPYLRSVLRDALGRAAKDSRLGNVRCVSAKRQWWTKELKEEIWHRGGGGWMVGKVNVGKSQLFQEVFPKGRMGDWGKHTTIREAMALKGVPLPKKDLPNYEAQETLETEGEAALAKEGSQSSAGAVNEFQKSELKPHNQAAPTAEVEFDPESFQNKERPEPRVLETEDSDPSTETLNTSSLLPPLPVETSYPAMPLVSSLPGTTASPIRVPFGNGKGELIDLPGLSRGDLELHVQPEHRASLVMRSRVAPVQHVLKPGQSLLIGGLIRITPTTPNLHILAYNFTPMQPHQTSTEKAIGIQTGTREANVQNIAMPGTGKKIASAGKFYLKYDVTKARAGPVTRKDAAGIKVERLPFRVFGIDILIEGVGWVELAAQVRKPRGDVSELRDSEERWDFEKENGEEDVDPSWPEIEVFSPEGRFVGQRRPMNAWLMLGDKPKSKQLKARPRKAMKGVKKTEKKRARDAKAPL